MKRLPGEINVSVEIADPLSPSQLAEIRSRWQRHLPGELIRYWTEGSSNLNGRYVWTPPPQELAYLKSVFEYNTYIYGGPRFIAASEVDPEPCDTSHFEGDIMSGSEEERQRTLDLWGRSIIILDVGNGDCLALDAEAPGCNPDDPPVIYLVHDNSSSDQICPRFSTFLGIWEQMSYIGPEHWLLNYWLDRSSRELSVDLHRTTELRQLLTPRAAGVELLVVGDATPRPVNEDLESRFVEIHSFRGRRSLRFHSCIGNSFTASIDGDEPRASIRIGGYTDCGLLVDLFESIARDWRGWQGERTWASVEGIGGKFSIAVSTTRTGKVTIVVELANNDGDDWRLSIPIFTEAGQLEDIARQVAAFFR